MTKKFYSAANLLLTSFIALMGFAACKTSRKVQQGSDTEKLYGPPPVQMTRADSIQAGLIPPPEQKVKPADVMKLVYGPPPVRKEKK
ncbi:MAG: hypothetical protein IJS63_02705 [Bacteroidaceae bacterium]|nr:hypothetical protein [Bacteroidaceae bacterium]